MSRCFSLDFAPAANPFPGVSGRADRSASRALESERLALLDEAGCAGATCFDQNFLFGGWVAHQRD